MSVVHIALKLNQMYMKIEADVEIHVIIKKIHWQISNQQRIITKGQHLISLNQEIIEFDLRADDPTFWLIVFASKQQIYSKQLKQEGRTLQKNKIIYEEQINIQSKMQNDHQDLNQKWTAFRQYFHIQHATTTTQFYLDYDATINYSSIISAENHQSMPSVENHSNQHHSIKRQNQNSNQAEVVINQQDIITNQEIQDLINLEKIQEIERQNINIQKHNETLRTSIIQWKAANNRLENEKVRQRSKNLQLRSKMSKIMQEKEKQNILVKELVEKQCFLLSDIINNVNEYGDMTICNAVSDYLSQMT